MATRLRHGLTVANAPGSDRFGVPRRAQRHPAEHRSARALRRQAGGSVGAARDPAGRRGRLDRGRVTRRRQSRRRLRPQRPRLTVYRPSRIVRDDKEAVRPAIWAPVSPGDLRFCRSVAPRSHRASTFRIVRDDMVGASVRRSGRQSRRVTWSFAGAWRPTIRIEGSGPITSRTIREGPGARGIGHRRVGTGDLATAG